MELRNLLNHLITVRCPYCRKRIHYKNPSCDKCAKKFPKRPLTRYTRGVYFCVSSLPYKEPFKTALWNFKFSKERDYSNQMGMLIARDIKAIYGDRHFDFITAVPIHKKDLAIREYNQSEFLARAISKELSIPYTEALIKKRYTKPQRKQQAVDRMKNVQGAYKVISKDIVRNKDILIIDDVITTGCTLGECAETLTKSGARSVHCSTLCSVV